MLKALTNGFSEIFKGPTLKTIAQSVGAILVSKNLPGVTQYGLSKAGQNVDLSGPIPALSSAILVSAFCYGKGWKVPATTTLAFAGGEQILHYWNKTMASTLSQPLVLPAIAGSDGMSDGMYSATPTISDGTEIINVPEEDGTLVPTRVYKMNDTITGSDGMSDYADLSQVEQFSNHNQYGNLSPATLSNNMSVFKTQHWN